MKATTSALCLGCDARVTVETSGLTSERTTEALDAALGASGWAALPSTKREPYTAERPPRDGERAFEVHLCGVCVAEIASLAVRP